MQEQTMADGKTSQEYEESYEDQEQTMADGKTSQEYEESYEDHELSFYDLAEQDGTLIYHQIDSNGNAISEEDY
jgi:hypothetical protein